MIFVVCEREKRAKDLLRAYEKYLKDHLPDDILEKCKFLRNSMCVHGEEIVFIRNEFRYLHPHLNDHVLYEEYYRYDDISKLDKDIINCIKEDLSGKLNEICGIREVLQDM